MGAHPFLQPANGKTELNLTRHSEAHQHLISGHDASALWAQVYAQYNTQSMPSDRSAHRGETVFACLERDDHSLTTPLTSRLESKYQNSCLVHALATNSSLRVQRQDDQGFPREQGFYSFNNRTFWSPPQLPLSDYRFVQRDPECSGWSQTLILTFVFLEKICAIKKVVCGLSSDTPGRVFH